MTYFEELINTKPKQPSTMVASISSKVLQIRKENIKLSLSDLNTVDHRQEYIATVDGVMYYDDSRAENVNATWFTFQNIVKPVIWIAGGNDRNTDFKDLKSIAKKKVKVLICIGKYNANLKKTFQKDIKDFYEVENLEEAVETAAFLAKQSDIVLFSPACVSDKEDETYIERGNLFTKTINHLQNECHQ